MPAPPRRRRVGQFIAIALTLIFLTVLFIAWQVSQADRIAGGQLVPFEEPKGKVRVDENANRPVDAVPEGFTAYANPELSFAFNYPKAWGELKPVEPVGLLNLATPRVEAYSLADALEVRAQPAAGFKIGVNDAGTTVTPQAKGAGFEWLIADKGTVKSGAVGKPYAPAPSLAYRAGKTVVYRILNSRANCTFDTYAFPVGANFVAIRLPAFCVSDKAADADIQATQKVEFEKQQQLLLRSITAL